ncbi:LacI family DNA-binding transcriptional regulator [Neobacillus niacini]|uniref:LacI family DNA-binding transcriptional regulator n=1 Tax=Neobacillus niacini TaxID=86668 RepID=UPI002FFD69C2
MKNDKQNINKANINDVAKMAGVSKTTISRFLSEQYDLLSVDTRKRIEGAIKELNYRPNRLARGLKGNRSGVIGIILSDISNPYFTSILKGAEEVCRLHGENLMVCNMDDDPIKEKECILMLQTHRIDGLIISSTGHNNDLLLELKKAGVSIVLIDRKLPELEVDFIGTNNIKATIEATTFLLDCGYDRIAYFTRPLTNLSSRRERATTFLSVLSEHREQNVDYIYEVDIGQSDILEQSIDHFLHQSEGQFACIFAGNAMLLLKIVILLQRKGIQIPEYISIVCFDDPEWAAVIQCGITAISQPTQSIGRIAMEKLLKRIAGDHSTSENTELEAEFIKRGSTLKAN